MYLIFLQLFMARIELLRTCPTTLPIQTGKRHPSLFRNPSAAKVMLEAVSMRPRRPEDIDVDKERCAAYRSRDPTPAHGPSICAVSDLLSMCTYSQWTPVQ